MRRFLVRYGSSRRGTAAIEFCMIAPIILLLWAGVVEFGSIIKVYYQINRLASQYAMAWSDCSDQPAGTCQTELGMYVTSAAISNMASGLDPTQVTVQMFQFQLNGTTPVPSYVYPANASMSAAQVAVASGGFVPNGQIGVMVTIIYQHRLKFFQTIIGPYLSSYLRPSYTIVQLKS